MKFKIVLLAAALVVTNGLWSQAADVLKLNKEKSKIGFVGKKTDGKHEGGFKEFTAEANANWDDPSKSTLQIDIDTGSLWSDNDGLTNHLKNPDFFDVRKYKSIKFQSTKIEHESETSAKITGKLTLLDKTEEIVVPCKVEVSDTAVIVEADFKIDRTKWGMNYGTEKINKEVDITATLTFKR